MTHVKSGVNSDGMTQTLWARKFYEIATHYVCAKNPQAAYLHEARLLSRLCVERYTTRSSTGSISRFERAWTSYTCFRDRGTSPADFALVGPPVILDTTLKACDGGFSFFLFFLLWGRWECWYSSSYFRVTRLGNGLLLLRRKCDIAAKPPH